MRIRSFGGADHIYFRTAMQGVELVVVSSQSIGIDE
jgi:hypothetical protein